MTRSLTKRRIAAFLFLAIPGLAGAQTPSAAGRWQGAIELPGQKLEIFIALAADGGAWSGAIDIPAQGAKGLQLTAINVEGSSVTFAISGIPGDPTFSGARSPEGDAISGDFTQGGQKFPFRLTRPDTGKAVAIVKDGEVVLSKGYGLRDVSAISPSRR